MHRSCLILLALLTGCPGGGSPDGGGDGFCTVDVTVGTGDRESFQPLVDGDPVEVVLGFQGFRMLWLSLQLDGADAEEARVSVFVEVPESALEMSQTNEHVPVAADGFVSQFLLFFNDAPSSALIGRRCNLEWIVRRGECRGLHRVEVMLRDDDTCVDPTPVDASVADGGGLDGGAPDGAIVCDGGAP